MKDFPLTQIIKLRDELKSHRVYSEVTDLDKLVTFMKHHIYSVWDFMSLVKYLQNEFAPTSYPWVPMDNNDVQRFINDIVLEEESDEALPESNGNINYSSHFMLYAMAMEEVLEGSSKQVLEFIENVKSESFSIAIDNSDIPNPSKKFMKKTFEIIERGKAHEIAAAFALGREHIIPVMFRELLAKMNISREQASVFHYYLDRHIELDGDHHGPMSMKMLQILCEDDDIKIKEAEDAALEAIQARIDFWNGVSEELNK